jgi:hypothetical protein
MYNTECRKSHLTLQSTCYTSKHQGAYAPNFILDMSLTFYKVLYLTYNIRGLYCGECNTTVFRDTVYSGR